MKKIRREKLGFLNIFFNKVDKLDMIDANVYVVVKINGKYFIY